MVSAAGPVVIVKLKRGWAFDVDTGTATRRGAKVQLMLPPGARLQALLPLPPPPRRHRTPAEHEIGRFLQLQPPPAMDGPAALALVRDWPFVESAELAPTA